MNTTHLTDDQIDDALIGDLAEECAAHLAGCTACRLRLAEAEAPIASFNEVTLAWSERRSATLPAQPARPQQAAWLPKLMWAATAAAVMAVGVAVPVARHRAQESNVVTASRGEPTAVTLMASTGPVENPVAAREEQIARDNQMLQGIDREIDSPDDSPAQVYGVHTVRSVTPQLAPAVRD